MGIINRFLLFVYAVVVLSFALFIIALIVRPIPDEVLFNEFRFLLHQSWTLTIFGAVSFFSLYFMLYAFFTGEKKETELPKDNSVIIKTETGEVRIAKDAIEALADREATSVSGVRESITEINVSNKDGEIPLSLKLSLILISGANVPKISDEVVKAVKNRIFDSLDIKDVPVSISVRDLNSAPGENMKRVH